MGEGVNCNYANYIGGIVSTRRDIFGLSQKTHWTTHLANCTATGQEALEFTLDGSYSLAVDDFLCILLQKRFSVQFQRRCERKSVVKGLGANARLKG